MARSTAYARIKDDVLALTRCIPPGRVSTYVSLGDHLDVMARHVAYILATLTEEEKVLTPWYRVTGNDGAISRANPTRAGEQERALEAEGLAVGANGRVATFPALFISGDELALRRRSQPHSAD